MLSIILIYLSVWLSALEPFVEREMPLTKEALKGNFAFIRGAALDFVSQKLDDIMKREEDRFSAIDGKASNYLGMLSVALSVLLSLGGLLLDKKAAIPQNIFDLCAPSLLVLYIASFLFLTVSFALSVEASKVQLEGIYIHPEYNLENLLAREYVSLLKNKEAKGHDNYKRVQAKHVWWIIHDLRVSSDYKAHKLSLAQDFARFGSMMFLGMLFILCIFILKKQSTKEERNENRSI
jgi:hypothetical protein